MRPDEYRLLMSEFGTERFNLHPLREYPLAHELPEDLRAVTYIENLLEEMRDSDYEGFAGACLDLAHLEQVRRTDPQVQRSLETLLERIPIGANHIGAFEPDRSGAPATRHRHWFESMRDFDYLKQVPLRHFGRFVAIEVCNPIADQIRVKTMLDRHLASL
jgi:hypothetical protein